MAPSLPVSRDTETKLQHILLHSARLFAACGFQGTSMRDISRATGVPLSGLYYYVHSKQELLYLIQNSTFNFVLKRLSARVEHIQEPQARLRALVQNHIEYFLSHPNQMKVLAHEEEALEAPYKDEIVAIKRRYYELAREIFDGVTADGLKPNCNPRVAVLSLFGMMNWVYKWHNGKVDPDAAQLTEEIMEIFLKGVLAEASGEKPLMAAGERVSRLD